MYGKYPHHTNRKHIVVDFQPDELIPSTRTGCRIMILRRCM